MKIKKLKWEELAESLIGRRVRVRSSRTLKEGIIENLIIAKDRRGRTVLFVELDNEARTIHHRYDFKKVVFLEDSKEKKTVTERHQTGTRNLYEDIAYKIRHGEAELLVRRHNVSAWRVSTRASAAPITAIYDEKRKIVMGVR